MLPWNPSRGGIAGVWRAGNETILLVEDDEQVRDLSSEALSASGYKVLLQKLRW